MSSMVALKSKSAWPTTLFMLSSTAAEHNSNVLLEI